MGRWIREGKGQIELSDEMDSEIEEIVLDEYYLFDSYEEFVISALRDKLLKIRPLKLMRKKVQLLESQQES